MLRDRKENIDDIDISIKIPLSVKLSPQSQCSQRCSSCQMRWIEKLWKI